MSRKFRAQMQRVGRAVGTLLCAIAAAAAVAACGDESTESVKRESTGVASAHNGESEHTGETAWLGLDDETPPEEWLVQRREKSVTQVGPHKVNAARVLLEEASQRFGDQSRMIANRAVQLEQMLAQKGYDEDAMALIETLMHVAPGSKPTGGFASICQYYFNLRVQGLDREQALSVLAERYGPDA